MRYKRDGGKNGLSMGFIKKKEEKNPEGFERSGAKKFKQKKTDTGACCGDVDNAIDLEGSERPIPGESHSQRHHYAGNSGTDKRLCAKETSR